MLKFVQAIKVGFDQNTTALLVTFVLGNALRLASNIILTRILFPEAFAIVGIVGSIFFILELSSDLGIRGYIIRHKNGNDKNLLDTLWTIRFIRSIILTLVMMASSWALADFFRSEELQPVFFISAFVITLTGFESLSFIVSERQNRVAKILYLQLLEIFISMALVIAISYFWRSYWPLIIGLILGKIVRIAFSYLFFKNPFSAFRLDMAQVRELWGYSKYIIPSSVISIVLMQGEKTVVVRVLDLSEAGVYFVAVTFSTAVFGVVTSYSRSVLYPFYAQVMRERFSELRVLYYQKKMVIILLFSFGCGFGIGCADLFFEIVYDERYAKGGSFLSLLLILPLLMTISTPAENCLVALGRVRSVLIGNILRIVWLLPAVYFAYTYFGVLGVVAAFSLMEILPIVYFWYGLAREELLVLHKEFFPLITAGAGFILSWSIVDFVTRSSL